LCFILFNCESFQNYLFTFGWWAFLIDLHKKNWSSFGQSQNDETFLHFMKTKHLMKRGEQGTKGKDPCPHHKIEIINEVAN
jgi:hypothetical protein